MAPSPVARASIPIQQVAPEKKSYYMSEGVFVGGHTQENLTLFNVRQSRQKHFEERLVFDIGNTRPGFFHISIQKNLHRLVIDLENTVDSKVTASRLKEIFRKSRIFKTPHLFQDTLTKSVTIEIPLKREVQVEVFELAGFKMPGRIVVDVK